MSRKKEGNLPFNDNITNDEGIDDKNMQIIVNEEENDELKNLKLALSQTLEQVHHLKKEIEYYEQNEQKLKTETEKIKLQCRKLEKEKKIAENIAKRNEYRFGRLEKKYSDLASSKLGKLTLNYWAWHNEHQKGKGSISDSFFIKWLFDRLPELQNNQELIQMPTQEITISKSDDKKEVVPSASKKPVATEYEMPLEQQKWIEAYTDRINSIPDSNGCRYYEKLQNKIGIVCDEFFYDSICSAANFVYLTPENWREELNNRLDALLFVSTWRGLAEEWKGMGSFSNKIPGRNKIADIGVELIRTFKENSIPTVFYSKEDPPNYELFLRYAKECDYVFTSASECIPYYNEECGRDDVKAICFGVNPIEHNPIGFYNPHKEKTILFSGSWMEKYPQRCKELGQIFDGVLSSEYQLHIVDRNYPTFKKYAYPTKYQKYTSPAVQHDKLQKLHKCFNWAINTNTVTTSDTMFANRAFELQANGVLLLSNYSVGINSLLPNVEIVHTPEKVKDILENMNSEAVYERQINGIRSVMTGHTCFDRIKELLAPTGICLNQPERKVLVIADKITDYIKQSFERQTYYEKELISSDELTANKLKKYDMITWFADNTYYDIFYLEDMINGFKYTACDYITKDAWVENGILNSGIEHNYVNEMKSKYRTVFWRSAFSVNYLLNLQEKPIKLANGYSIDHLNYELNPVEKIAKRENLFKISVILPVYNNGNRLYTKSFASLKRSSIFNDMEIIIVDDGSTDEYTLKIEQYLKYKYPNVKLYQFEEGGSGSAARPRNKALELSTAKYIVYLDPDDEAVDDNYSYMLDIIESNECDLIIGNAYKFTDNIVNVNFAKDYINILGSNIIEPETCDFIKETKFRAPNIQTMIINKSLIINNNLVQTVGAMGEDTLFSWELMSCAKKIYFIDLPVFSYYAKTSGSVTNVLNSKYFEKLLKIQQPKIKWLIDNNLLEDFMNTRYDMYTKNWVLAKLAQSAGDEIVQCTKTVYKILIEYDEYYNNTDETINNFIQLCKDNKYEVAFEIIKNLFSVKQIRPMPTSQELYKIAMGKKVTIEIEYERKGSSVIAKNLNNSNDCTFAWSIIIIQDKYQSVYTTKYSKAKTFTYDFSTLEPKAYKLRAFELKEGKKTSQDVLYVNVRENKKIDVDRYF